MSFFHNALRFCSVIGCLLFMLSGCASLDQETNPTSIDAQWVNPSATFEQKTITGILVSAITDNPTTRRIFEDSACNVLALKGIPAQPSYQYLTDPQALISGQNLNISALQHAARQAGASDILIVKKRAVKNNIIYNPGMTWGPDPFWGPGPWGGPFGPSPFWADGWAIPPSVTQQQIAETNAELINVKNAQVLWTASLSTILGAESAAATYQGYIDLVFQSLIQNGFLVPITAPNYPVAPASQFNPSTNGALPAR